MNRTGATQHSVEALIAQRGRDTIEPTHPNCTERTWVRDAASAVCHAESERYAHVRHAHGLLVPADANATLTMVVCRAAPRAIVLVALLYFQPV